MSEPSVAPPAAEAQENESVNALLASYERFFAGPQAGFDALAQTIRRAIADHEAAHSRLLSSLKDGREHPWQPVAGYIESVRDCVVLPLRGELAKLNLVETTTNAWLEEIASTGSPWPRLSKKDQQRLSPLLPLWQSAAPAIAEIEIGVPEWTRLTLDAASALDCAQRAAAPNTAGQNSAEAQVAEATAGDSTPFDAASEQLVQRLGNAQQILDGLADASRQSLREIAKGRRKTLDAASAKDEQATVETDSQDGPPEESVSSWQTWFDQANARIELAAARLAAFSALAKMQISFVARLGEDGPGVWTVAANAASGHLQELRQQTEQLYAELDESKDGRKAIRQATEIFKRAMSRLENEYVGVASPDEARRFVEQCSNTTLADIKQQAQSLPESMRVHSLPEDSSVTVNPRAPTREVTLRPAAMQAIDTILLPALAACANTVQASITILSEENTNLQSVLRFHLGAATEELREAYWTRSSPTVRQQADDAARELSLAGLDRVVEALAQQQKRVDDCLASVSAQLTDARRTMWLTIGSQVQAETATQKLTLKTRSTMTAYLLDLKTRAGQTLAALLKQSWHQLQLAYQKVKGALHYGRKAVTGENEPADREGTIDAVARLSDIRAGLPVVYRRLFSFYPLSDKTLLAGRDNDLTWLRQQVLLWRSGRTSAYVLSSNPGCGLTTFLNVARQTCLPGDVTDVDITQRLMDERELTTLLMDALPLEPAGEPPATLRALADLIMAAEVTASLNVCIVERLEHLFLRQIGGTDLLGRMLRFFSATDSRVFWIATVSDFAWQLLEKNEPLALGLVKFRKMSAYDRASVEEVVIRRHRRSGLPLVFDSPAVISPFFKRRLKRDDTEEATQALLQKHYFDDLFAASGQNIMLALFYWHLSITFRSEPASLQVHALPKLSFEFLNLLSLSEAFALKAFLEHATLTVGEYSQIANISVETSHETFESLGNSMIVELDVSEYRNVANVEFERIEADRRYRVRPLLVQPVIRYLRSKNIVH